MDQLRLKTASTFVLLVILASGHGFDPNEGLLVSAPSDCEYNPSICANAAADARNLTSLTGTAGTGSVIIGAPIGGGTKSCLLCIPAEMGTSAAIENEDGDVTTETVLICDGC